VVIIMAISFQFGSGSQDTAIDVSMAPWIYTAAFRKISDNGSNARMTDILSPLDKKTSIKISLAKIANVYSTLADNSVPAAEQSANVSGATVFVELKTIATKVVDSVTIQIPLVSRIELRIPFDSEITEADITTLVMSTFAALCDEDGNPVVVTEKMRGALLPAEV
jgi:uncharacterized protein YejL (UPF0352 family)